MSTKVAERGPLHTRPLGPLPHRSSLSLSLLVRESCGRWRGQQGILVNWGRRCYKAPRKSAPASTPDIPSVLFRPRGDAGYVGALKIIAGARSRDSAGPPRSAGMPLARILCGGTEGGGGRRRAAEGDSDPLYWRQRWQLECIELRPVSPPRCNKICGQICGHSPFHRVNGWTRIYFKWSRRLSFLFQKWEISRTKEKKNVLQMQRGDKSCFLMSNKRRIKTTTFRNAGN